MKDSRTVKTIGARVTALVSLALVAGCSSAGSPNETADPIISEVSTVAPSTEPQAEVPVPGQVFADKPEDLPEGVSAYQVADGTYVAVTRADPLPDPVRAELQSKVDVQIQDPGTPEAEGTMRSVIVDTAQEVASLAGLKTGKSVVIIYPLVGNCPGDSDPYLGWMHTHLDGADDGCRVLPTFEASRAEVDAAIAATGKPEEYEVFVHAG